MIKLLIKSFVAIKFKFLKQKKNNFFFKTKNLIKYKNLYRKN